MPPMDEVPKFLLVAVPCGLSTRYITKFGENTPNRRDGVVFSSINALVNWVRRNDLAIEVKVMREVMVYEPTVRLEEV